jgi:cholesterol oxidase
MLMNRRQALKGLGAGAAALALPRRAEALIGSSAYYRWLIPEVFAAAPSPPDYTPALVIGSGFGGAISALRLAQAGVETAVLERGFRWPKHPTREIFTDDTLADGRGFWFRNTAKSFIGLPDLPIDRFGGVLDWTEYQNIDVLRGACVGGGSVVFTGVMIQPRRSYFDAIFEGRVSYDEMNAVYYPRVREMLRLSPMPGDVYNSGPFGHSRAWDKQAKRAGYQVEPADSIFNWDVVRAELCGQSRPSATIGQSNLGNSNGAKFDLNQNYLKDAQATGNVGVYPGHEVKDVFFDGTHYLVDVVARDPEGHELGRRVIACDRLFLAAGSIGTSELLVRARAKGNLPNLNEQVGRGWGSNGDTAVARSLAFFGGLTTGSPCASRLHDDGVEVPTTFENWYGPGLAINAALVGTLGIAFDLENRGDFAYDAANDRVNLLWPENGNDAAVAAARVMNDRICDASLLVIPGLPPLIPDVRGDFTAHPLGGAVLGKATDDYGRVLGYDGLYVVDGAAIPGTTGAVNPSLTISALAERNIERIIAEDLG